MEKLRMHTPDLAEENFRKLAAMFPNAVTETINEDGEVVRAIDADVLRQEISVAVVEGAQDRYQFTWPDKTPPGDVSGEGKNDIHRSTLQHGFGRIRLR